MAHLEHPVGAPPPAARLEAHVVPLVEVVPEGELAGISPIPRVELRLEPVRPRGRHRAELEVVARPPGISEEEDRAPGERRLHQLIPLDLPRPTPDLGRGPGDEERRVDRRCGGRHRRLVHQRAKAIARAGGRATGVVRRGCVLDDAPADIGREGLIVRPGGAIVRLDRDDDPQSDRPERRGSDDHRPPVPRRLLRRLRRLRGLGQRLGRLRPGRHE